MRIFDTLIEAGIPPQKMVIGVQFLAHKFKHRQEDIDFEETMGLSFACELWKKNRVANVLTGKQPKTYNSIEFENFEMITKKVEFIRSRCLAGVVIFPVNTDDFFEKCGESYVKGALDDHQFPNPFLRKVYQGLLEETKDDMF